MKITNKKKKPRRSDSKYPALDPKLNPKIRGILADYDYVDKLSEKDKSWLNAFTEEYVNANFKHKGKKLHKSKKAKRESYNRNNWRNNDVLNIAQVTGRSESVSDFKKILDQKKQKDHEVEDMLIAIIDGEFED